MYSSAPSSGQGPRHNQHQIQQFQQNKIKKAFILDYVINCNNHQGPRHDQHHISPRSPRAENKDPRQQSQGGELLKSYDGIFGEQPNNA